jgi:hypothetical protein
MKRREFLKTSFSAVIVQTGARARPDIRQIERVRVLKAAEGFLGAKPVTVTASQSSRSAGGNHDFFSEGDYWWPDPQNPNGPYVQRDGMTNPDNFVAHRQALMRLSVIVPALASAWILTRERRYATDALRHARAWFTDEATLMNPRLEYAQAIKGRFTGRGIGIIDTIHLVEVVRALSILEKGGVVVANDANGFRRWFSEYLDWMTTHQYGKDERDAKNNHGTCWVMQVAEFARYVGRADLTAFCRDRFKTVLLPNQLAEDGSFPLELRRTKPYGYCLFNLDALATVCQILTTRHDDLWRFELPDGRGMRKAMGFMFPFIADKSRWPHPPDVMYFDQWPMRQVSLLFAGLALNERSYLDLWQKLKSDSDVEEVVRNFPVRQPLLWL